MALNPKQDAFVAEYLVDLNGKQAAIRAGYSPKGAEVTASKLLRVPKVKIAVQEAQKTRSQRVQISQDAVLNELAKIGFANMIDYITISGDGTAGIDLSKLTREQAAAIVELTSEDTYDKEGNLTRRNKIKLADKRGALGDIGKHLGLFKDGITAVAMIVNISSDDASL